MAKYQYRINDWEYDRNTVDFKIGDRWINEQVIIAFNELSGIDRLDDEFKQLMESGEETKKSLSQIEKFRNLYNTDQIEYEKVDDRTDKDS